jgi:hypothetical protein
MLLASCHLKVNTRYHRMLLKHNLTINTQYMLITKTMSYTYDKYFVTTEPSLVLSYNNYKNLKIT